MINRGKKSILVVSFGTTYPEVDKVCIGATEKQIAESFPGYEVRRAFTSEKVRKILYERDNLQVDNTREALEKLRKDDFREVIIQPLHIIWGEEYQEKVLKVAAEYKDVFDRIVVGKPLLTTVSDYEKAIEALKTQLPGRSHYQAVVLMGHGSDHPANACYACLQLMLMDVLPHVYVGTVEGYPGLEHILRKLNSAQIKEVILMPFMLVAGDHAHNDLAGSGDDSWKSILEKEGCQVEIYLHGLGENPAFREIYLQHVNDSLAN